MKIRNGFVSNSSSSSFIINYPEKPLRLSEVENYFGGYNAGVEPYIRDLVNYMLWKHQFTNDGKELEQAGLWHCTLPEEKVDEEFNRWESPYYRRSSFSQRCPRHLEYAESYECEGCKYYKKASEKENFEASRESCWGEDLKEWYNQVEKHLGRIRSLTIDDTDYDNRDNLGLSYEDRYTVNDAVGNLFRDHSNVFEEGK